MGDAKRNRQRHNAISRAASECIYCDTPEGGITIDHMPPRLMFRLTQRPKGLEFPCCRHCNLVTSKLDVVAAFMTRTFPGIQNDIEGDEWDRVLREANRVAPGIQEEMFMPEFMQTHVMRLHGIYNKNLAVLRANGPILSSHMQYFSAKVGFALHFAFSGERVKPTERIQIRWFTSEEMASRKIPQSLFDSIGAPITMKQGKITSDSLFEYGSGKYIKSEKNKRILCEIS